MLFWTILLFVVIFGWLYATYVSNNYKLMCFIMMAGLFFISAFRNHIGNDYDTYVKDFYDYANFTLDTLLAYVRREPTETLIVYILHEYDFDYQMLFVIYSLFTFCFLWIILRDTLRSYQLALIGIVAFVVDYNLMWYSYSIIRQFVAALICLWSLKYIDNNNPIKFICSVLFATLWHYSAFAFALMYFIPRNKIKTGMYAFLMLVGLIIFYTNSSLKFVEFVLSYIPLAQGYAWYLYDWMEDEAVTLSMYFFYHLLLGFVFIKYIGNDKAIYVNAFCLFNFITLLFRFCTPLLRMSIYLGVSIIVLIPLLYSNIRRYRNLIFVMLIFIPLSFSCLRAIAREEDRLDEVGIGSSIGNIQYDVNFKHIMK